MPLYPLSSEKDKGREKEVMVRYKYSNGHYEIRIFPTWKDADWFGRMEPHCKEWKQIN